MFQRLITNLKYYFDSTLQLDKNHDLNEICQFLLPSTNIDHGLYKKSGLLVARNILDIKEIDLWRTNIENQYVKDIYDYTFRERGQGTGPKEELFWKKLDEKSLKPKFIDSFNEL